MNLRVFINYPVRKLIYAQTKKIQEKKNESYLLLIIIF